MEFLYLGCSFLICLLVYFYFKRKLDSYNSFKLAINEKEKELNQIVSNLGSNSDKLEVVKSNLLQLENDYKKLDKDTKELQELKKNSNALKEELNKNTELTIKLKQRDNI